MKSQNISLINGSSRLIPYAVSIMWNYSGTPVDNLGIVDLFIYCSNLDGTSTRTVIELTRPTIGHEKNEIVGNIFLLTPPTANDTVETIFYEVLPHSGDSYNTLNYQKFCKIHDFKVLFDVDKVDRVLYDNSDLS